MLKWLNKNHHQVISLYKNQCIAYNEKVIVSHDENSTEFLQLAELSGEHF